MKKKNDFKLKSLTDIKVYMLYLLDHIAYPVDHSTLIEIVSEATGEISLRYDDALQGLADSNHINFDEIDGEKYYMINELGKKVSAELYDSLDAALLENSLRTAAKYISFKGSGVKISTSIKEREDHRFVVNLVVCDGEGEVMNMSLTVKSRMEAERIAANFEARPEKIYRGFLVSATGLMEYFS
jgi:hypothetical protein